MSESSGAASRAHHWHVVRVCCALCAIAALLLSACERPAADIAAAAPPPQVRDSAGIRIVSAGFVRDEIPEQEALAVIDTLLDGAVPATEAVVGLLSMQPLTDSSLVLFSASGPSLLRFSSFGANASPDTLGAPGSAAGAYSTRSTLLPFHPDTLLLWDADAARLTRVTASGLGDAITLQFDPRRIATVSGAWSDGTPIAVTVALPGEQGAGVSRAAMALLRFTPDGAFRDTLLHMRGPERAVLLGRSGSEVDVPVRVANIPLGRTSLWTVGRDNVLVLDTESCNVIRHDSTGAVTLRLEFHCTIEAVTEEDQSRFMSEVLATARSRSDSAVRRRMASEASFPPAKSTASGLLADRWDRIWVRLPVTGLNDDWVWWVFDSDGMPLSRLRLARQWRIAAVRERDLIAVEADRDDAPPVVVRMALPAVLRHTP